MADESPSPKESLTHPTQPIEPVPAQTAKPTIIISFPVSEQVGDRIAHYKLLQRIGEGGCRVVYLAEQDKPLRRRVALKVIQLGMDTKSAGAKPDSVEFGIVGAA